MSHHARPDLSVDGCSVRTSRSTCRECSEPIQRVGWGSEGGQRGTWTHVGPVTDPKPDAELMAQVREARERNLAKAAAAAPIPFRDRAEDVEAYEAAWRRLKAEGATATLPNRTGKPGR